MKTDKKKGKESTQPSRSFQRGMLAAFGEEDVAELSSSDDEFPMELALWAIEDPQVQSSTLVSNDDLEFDDDKYDDVYDAYAQLVIIFDKARSKVISLLKEKESLEDSNESLQEEVVVKDIGLMN